METWENDPIVYLTTDSDQWDPHAASLADALKRWIEVCYAEPGTWESFEQLVDDQACGTDDLSYSVLDDNEATLSCDGIRVQLASLTTVYETKIFSAVLDDQAYISRLSMAVGSTTIDDVEAVMID